MKMTCLKIATWVSRVITDSYDKQGESLNNNSTGNDYSIHYKFNIKNRINRNGWSSESCYW